MDAKPPWRSVLREMKRLKEAGTLQFKAGQMDQALQAYEAALALVAGRRTTSLPPQVEGVAAALYSNAAACALKLSRREAAAAHCRAGLACSTVWQDGALHFKLWTRHAEATGEEAPLGRLALAPSNCLAQQQRVRDLIGTLFGLLLGSTPPSAASLRSSVLDRIDASLHVDARDGTSGGMGLLWAASQFVMQRKAPSAPLGWLVGELIKRGADPNQRYESEHQTALMYCACAGDTPQALEAVAALIAAGADVNAVDADGFSALLIALSMGEGRQSSIRMVQLLLDAGADVNVWAWWSAEKRMGGFNAFHLAVVTYGFGMEEGHDGSDDRVEDPAIIRALLSARPTATTLSQRSIVSQGLTPWQSLLKVALAWKEYLPVLDEFTAAMRSAGLDLAEDELAVRFLHLFNAVATAHDKVLKDLPPHEGNTPAAGARQERKCLEVLLKLAGLPAASKEALIADPNPLLTLHSYITTRLPLVCSKVYQQPDAPVADVGALIALRGGADPSAPLLAFTNPTLFCGQPPTGGLFVWTRYGQFLQTVLDPIKHAYSYAVPNDEALDALVGLSPLLEVGAGSCYWTQVLRAHGADVVASDRAAPRADTLNNAFHSSCMIDAWRLTVCEGRDAAAAHPERALVLMYPFKPGMAAWDADALSAYRGDTVAHVGSLPLDQPPEERAACELHGDDLSHEGGKAGETTSHQFQRMLREHFTLVGTVPLPRWPYGSDALTIWRRKGAGAQPSRGVCNIRADCECDNCASARRCGDMCALPRCGARAVGAAYPLSMCSCRGGEAYCSTEHQQEDWQRHRPACKAARGAGRGRAQASSGASARSLPK